MYSDYGVVVNVFSINRPMRENCDQFSLKVAPQVLMMVSCGNGSVIAPGFIDILFTVYFNVINGFIKVMLSGILMATTKCFFMVIFWGVLEF